MNKLAPLFEVLGKIDFRSPNLNSALDEKMRTFSCEDLLAMDIAIGELLNAFQTIGVFDVIHKHFEEYDLSDDGVANVFAFFICFGEDFLERTRLFPESAKEILDQEDMEEMESIGEIIICCCARAIILKGC